MRDRRQQNERWQRDTRARQGSAAGGRIRIKPAWRAIHQRVAPAAGGLLKPVVRADEFAAGHELNLDQIFESTANDLGLGSIGPAAEERACHAFKKCPVTAWQLPAIGFAHREIEQAIGPEGEAVQAAVVRVAEPAENHLALVRASVAIGVGQRNQLRRVGEIKPPVVPRKSHRKCHARGENCRLIETSITIRILQPRHPAVAREFLQARVEIVPRRLRDVEPPGVVVAGKHGKPNHGFARRQIDGETRRHAHRFQKDVVVECRCRERASRCECPEQKAGASRKQRAEDSRCHFHGG